ncbi:unnamed protein product [Notodromas monacha]|uniref:SCP domain-containing protein n=1 Tax=Notodromas monacha TaxID=399045 RepID=A0A7R9GKB7_9CRUS|nr:unnamed protein product [Notodromas monacha]CAG0923728.1 unnamed protein product [Notodromas monacha]
MKHQHQAEFHGSQAKFCRTIAQIVLVLRWSLVLCTTESQDNYSTGKRFVSVHVDPEDIVGLGSFIPLLNKSCKYIAPYDVEPHSACLLPNPRIQIRRVGVSPDEKELILHLHNILRSKVAQGQEKRGLGGRQPPAELMLELVWDDELAMVAQSWASQGYDPRLRSDLMPNNAHDCNTCRSVPRYEYVGQNVAWTGQPWQKDKTYLPSRWEHHIHQLYDEVDHFNPKYVPRFKRSKGDWHIGHYTQIVWGKSAKIGCGAAYYDCMFQSRKSNRTAVPGQCLKYVCNYGPAGNFPGEPVYVTPAASNNQSGMKVRKSRCVVSSSQYPGLCAMQTFSDLFFDVGAQMSLRSKTRFANNQHKRRQYQRRVATGTRRNTVGIEANNNKRRRQRPGKSSLQRPSIWHKPNLQSGTTISENEETWAKVRDLSRRIDKINQTMTRASRNRQLMGIHLTMKICIPANKMPKRVGQENCSQAGDEETKTKLRRSNVIKHQGRQLIRAVVIYPELRRSFPDEDATNAHIWK